eukprot:Rmarinus@m.16250
MLLWNNVPWKRAEEPVPPVVVMVVVTFEQRDVIFVIRCIFVQSVVVVSEVYVFISPLIRGVWGDPIRDPSGEGSTLEDGRPTLIRAVSRFLLDIYRCGSYQAVSQQQVNVV